MVTRDVWWTRSSKSKVKNIAAAWRKTHKANKVYLKMDMKRGSKVTLNYPQSQTKSIISLDRIWIKQPQSQSRKIILTHPLQPKRYKRTTFKNFQTRFSRWNSAKTRSENLNLLASLKIRMTKKMYLKKVVCRIRELQAKHLARSLGRIKRKREKMS